MKGRPVEQLVYETMFPKPRQQDPHNFQSLLQRHLVLEVRQEVHSFYGHLDTPEAKYPGLDYTHPVHRIRLSRWPWHRRLFRAFDALRLTHAEISGLTKWEGTKWAKERFEREQGIVIHDTTADGFTDFVEPEDRVTPDKQDEESHDAEPTVEAVVRAVAEARVEASSVIRAEAMRQTATEASPDDDSEGELESVGVALNERLLERVTLRNVSGDMSVSIDEEWETWFKQAVEQGVLDGGIRLNNVSSTPGAALTVDDVFPAPMVEAARAGNWEQVPDFLRDMIAQALRVRLPMAFRPEPEESQTPRIQTTSSTQPTRRIRTRTQTTPRAQPRDIFPRYRIPGVILSREQRLAQDVLWNEATAIRLAAASETGEVREALEAANAAVEPQA